MKNLKGRNVFRSVFIIPFAISPVVTGLLWRNMYEPSDGVINSVLGFVGLPTSGWLASPAVAMPALILANVWQYTPLAMILLLAALQTVPREPLEAAQLDGASKVQTFRYVTLPLLWGSVLTALLLVTILSFKVFSLIFLTTAGGPGESTEVMSITIYKLGIYFFRINPAAALSMILLIICTGVAIAYMRKWEV